MKAFAVVALLGLTGCMTIEQVKTTSTPDLINTACVNPGFTPRATLDAAWQELASRGVDCRAIAMQTLMMRGAAPMPVQQAQPIPFYEMRVQPRQAPTYNAPSTFGTLIGSRAASTVAGAPAYLCQYRVATGIAEVIRPTAAGPCPPTANLQ